MGINQPDGWEKKALLSDPSLPHQKRIVMENGKIYVTCNCKRDKVGKGHYKYTRYKPQALAPTTKEANEWYDAHLKEISEHDGNL